MDSIDSVLVSQLLDVFAIGFGAGAGFGTLAWLVSSLFKVVRIVVPVDD